MGCGKFRVRLLNGTNFSLLITSLLNAYGTVIIAFALVLLLLGLVCSGRQARPSPR